MESIAANKAICYIIAIIIIIAGFVYLTIVPVWGFIVLIIGIILLIVMKRVFRGI